MATDTIKLLDEGGMQGCYCKCKDTESIQNLWPLLPLLWSNAFSLSNQIYNSQLLLACPNNGPHRWGRIRNTGESPSIRVGAFATLLLVVSRGKPSPIILKEKSHGGLQNWLETIPLWMEKP